jgi:isochorismate synthase EntC
MQSNIEINRFTNFLKQGAFVRKQGHWILLSDPSETPSDSLTRTVKTDFITSVTTRKHYKNQWDMTSGEFERLINLMSEHKVSKREKIIIDWSPVDGRLFTESFEKAQSAFRAGSVEKVVPILVQRGQLKNVPSLGQKLECLRLLARLPERLYPYGEWNENEGFMGATPEILFSVHDHELTTMALAGTAGKEMPLTVFLSDPKERKEHQIVVDDIKAVLSAVADVSEGTTRVIELPSLNHLQTMITARLHTTMSTDQLIQLLHPTPALGIFPRNQYFKVFSQYPCQSERGFFGAPWGVEFSNESLMLVAIRKWDWSGKDVQIFAGCGVVPESVQEKEFAEILKKIDSVKRIFFQE